MKKVGIITIIDNENCGNRLQNFALQETIKTFNYDVYTIKNDKLLNSKEKYLFNYLRYIKKKMRQLKGYKKSKQFYRFNKNIKFTKKLYTCKNKKLNFKFDYFIVGSDQVWKPTKKRLSYMDLLEFADNKKKVSYAASFGIDNIDLKAQRKIEQALPKFKAISVRENIGKKIVEDITKRKDVEVLVDPTMLLTSNDWDKISVRPRMLKSDKYILCYFLGDVNNKRKENIEKIAKKNGCEIIYMLDKNSPFNLCGPSEFVYLEKNAFLVCTDSFHSSVFAILYNTPFIVFDREDGREKMNSRIDTLLSKFKLEDRKYRENILEEQLKCDYTDAKNILELEREKSIKFLKKALDIKIGE